MYLYSAVSFVTNVLSYCTCYVLLAANMEDFRSLAKEIVPNGMADEILEMAKESMKRDNMKSQAAFRMQSNDDEPAEDEETELTTPPKYNKVNKTPKDSITLDELVEKVKQRLQKELAMASKTNNNRQEKRIVKNANPPSLDETPNQEIKDKPQSKYIQQSEEEVEDKTTVKAVRIKNLKSQTPDARYVAETFAAKPPKYLYDLGKSVQPGPGSVRESKFPKSPIQPRLINNRDKILKIKKIVRIRKPAATTESAGFFEGVDMTQTNDSYEDYKIPKRDDDYYEPSTEKTKYKVIEKTPLIQRPKVNKKVRKNVETLSVKSQTTTEGVENEYNEEEAPIDTKIKGPKQNIARNIDINPKDTAIVGVERLNGDSTELIQPYAEQLQGPQNVEENEEEIQYSTEEPKARSEIISLNEYKISQYAPVANNARNNIHKYNNIRKIATVIPKRDIAYKMSSPNYLVKLPIIGEKYQFDEPIPESDRIAEKPDDTIVKALINGKVINI